MVSNISDNWAVQNSPVLEGFVTSRRSMKGFINDPNPLVREKLHDSTISEWKKATANSLRSHLTEREASLGATVELLSPKVVEHMIGGIDPDKIRLIGKFGCVRDGHPKAYLAVAALPGWNDAVRGGYKPNSGRPPGGSEKSLKTYNFRLTIPQAEWIRRLSLSDNGSNNRSEKIRALIKAGIYAYEDRLARGLRMEVRRAEKGSLLISAEGIRLEKAYENKAGLLQESSRLNDYQFIQAMLQVGLLEKLEKSGMKLGGSDKDSFESAIFYLSSYNLS